MHPTQSIPVYVTAFVHILHAVHLLMYVEPSHYDIYIKMCANSNQINTHIALAFPNVSSHVYVHRHALMNFCTLVFKEI